MASQSVWWARSALRAIREDLETVVQRDVSVRSLPEAVLHPTVPAVWLYRIAALLYARDARVTARILSNIARFLTGVEIHPGARIGRRFFIDHGIGVVIGETAVIGDDVTLYHQVTLGALGWWKDDLRPAGERRHPQLGDHVVVGANASVIGPVRVGDGAVIGAQALVLKDVAPGQHAVAEPSRPAVVYPGSSRRHGCPDPFRLGHPSAADDGRARPMADREYLAAEEAGVAERASD
jgi:serine O-acetyltransferase